jgi:hypothetical protein
MAGARANAYTPFHHVGVGTRDDLSAVVEAAVRPGEPERLLVVFRLAGFDEFAARFGENSMETLAGYIALYLPNDDGRSSFYFRPRRDELCVLVEGQLATADEGLSAAARTVVEALGPEGITLGYSTTLLPYDLVSFIDAITRADHLIVDTNGKPMTRNYRTAYMTLRKPLAV